MEKIAKKIQGAKLQSMLATLLVIACAACYDFYYPGVGRAFDLVGLAILCTWYVFTYGFSLKRVAVSLALIGVVLTASLITIGGDVRHIIGLTLVVVFFKLYRDYFRRHIEQCWYALQIVAIAIAIIFFVQLVTHIAFKHTLDITSFVGSIPARIFNPDTHYFRAASIYQEPNSYAVFAFMIASLLILRRRKGMLALCALWLMLLTMIISQSLWGMSVSIILLLFAMLVKYISVKSVFFASFTLVLLSSAPLWYHERTSNRILNLAQDPTVTERYFGAIGDIGSPKKFVFPDALPSVDRMSKFAFWGQERRDTPSLSGEANWTELLFGNGLRANGFQQAYGASAWSYLLYNLGLLGVLLFISIVLKFDRTKFHMGSGCIFLLFTSFPYFTYVIFALYIVMLLDAGKNKADA
jgi:hypothetical protein